MPVIVTMVCIIFTWTIGVFYIVVFTCVRIVFGVI